MAGFFHNSRFVAACIAAALLLCGCQSMEDRLPDSYYETDTITVTQITSAQTAPPISNAETAASVTASPSETSPSETAAPDENASVTETTSETVSSDETAADTTASAEQSVTSDNTAEEFIPGTLPPPETKPTEPAITIVTIPTSPSAQESSPFSELTSETYTDKSEVYYPQNSYYTLNFARQKAVWISYLEFDRIMRNKNEDEFTAELNKCMDNIATLGCNTVYFQVRAYGDAYYNSDIYPSGDRLTGSYDPLEIAVKSAHDRGLSIHAWINPMRLMTDSQMKELPSDCVIAEWYADPLKNGTYLVNSNGRWYLNPAYSEVVSLICSGISEIVTGYSVDGVQIDDYFYPTTNPSFDAAAFSSAPESTDLADWRRSIINQMVKQMYSAVHSANPEAVFGISPQGSFDNNYNELYADIYTWLSEPGYCDYICPQIYYGFDNSTLPYAETVDRWSKLITIPDISLVIGLAAYKSGTEDKYAGDGKYEWQNFTDILSRQRDFTDIYNAGYAFFRYDSLFLPDPSIAASVNAEMENLKR